MTARSPTPKAQAPAPSVRRSKPRPPPQSEGTKAASARLLGADLPPARPVRRPTELPGVFLNADGLKVDENGVLLTLKPLQEAEALKDEDILGEPVTTPAQLLKRVALDPTLPLSMRLAAAVSAAPYYDRKMPTALEGTADGPPIKTDNSVLIRNLNGLTTDERRAALALLEKLGVLG